MTSTSNSSDTLITNTVTNILNNGYVFAVLAIIAFSYGQRAGPKLPPWLMNFFQHDIVRVLFLSLLLVVRFESRPTIAIIIALVFVYIIQYIYVSSTNEQFIDMLEDIKMTHKKRSHSKKGIIRNKNNM